MNKQQPYSRYLVLFFPWVIALMIQSYAVESYLVAWLGTTLIFILTLSGWVKPLPNDLPIEEQLLRPIFIVQIIFAGYMAFSSIFYFLSLLGYRNFTHTKFLYFHRNENLIYLAAKCQRYYLLGHAAFATGILYFMDYPNKKKYSFKEEKIVKQLISVCFIFLIIANTIGKLPGYSQIYFQFLSLSFFSGTLTLALSISQKKIYGLLISTLLYAINLRSALTSGFKEPIIISILVLGIFLYPYFKKIVLIVFIPLLTILFIYLPKYNETFRQSAWRDGNAVEDAYELALDATFESERNNQISNWDFLVGRLSEIEMFTQYVTTTPKTIHYYGFQIIKQSLLSIIPREIWHKKPSTEKLIMERVYKADVIDRISNVSAKPAFIVDCYLSAGEFGIFIFLFIYGSLAQLISAKAEILFGGYYLGTAIIFSGLFQFFWRGLSFEFLFNSIFWSYISMLAIFRLLKFFNIIVKI